MSSFLFSFNALTSFTGGNPPTLELLIGGVVVSSIEMISGNSSYDVLLDYTGAAPSSFSIRFAGSSGDPGDTISITSASVNNTALNIGTDLTATLLSQSQSAAVTAANALYGHQAPTIGTPDTTGTGGDDGTLHGSNEADAIDALAGNDYVRGRGGDDEITGGDGDDYIFGEDGADTILGGNGNDIIFGNADNDILYGEGDDDYLIAGDGDDLLNGGAGNDYLIGEAGADILFGEDGDDYLIGGDGDDLLFGDDGNDVLVGGMGNDSMAGGAGNDQLIGEAGNDLLSGGDGNDEIIAGTGDDVVSGGAGDDNIYGGDGADELAGGDDNDIVYGGAGDDDLRGDDGNDTLVGGAGADTMDGGAGDDILHGHGLDAETISTILQANPNVVYNSATGSFYQFVNANVNYATAVANAASTTLSGVSGHLAVITSQAENDFIQTLLADNSWIAATDSLVNTEWRWDAGIESGAQFSSNGTAVNGWYENWDSGQPQDNTEHNAVMYTNGTWHDWPGTSAHSYIIEWEAGLFSDDNAADTISGGEGSDWIYGYGGDDVLIGDNGNDYLFGGAGNDTISGGGNNDLIYGGAGDDDLSGGSNSDTIYGEDGDDTIDGGSGADILVGGLGSETITGGTGNDIIYASVVGTVGAQTVVDGGGGGGPIDILTANYSSGTNGFSYADGVFGSSGSSNSYASGTRITTDGDATNSGALQISLGGINNNTITNMSGAYQHTFVLADDMTNVTLDFSYRVLDGQVDGDPFDNGEDTTLYVDIDGTTYSNDANPYFFEITGSSAGASYDSGWQTISLDVGALSAGSHTISLGALLDSKTFASEMMEVRFDDLVMQGEVATTVTLLDETFSGSAGSFSYSDGSDPGNVDVSGSYQGGDGGVSNGSIQVYVDGQNNSAFSNAWGYYEQSVTPTEDLTNVQITFQYRHWQDESNDNGETSDAFFALDGTTYSAAGAGNWLNTHVGVNGNGGDDDTGWVTVTIDLPDMVAGNTYDLWFGILHEGSNRNNEDAYARFDDIVLTGSAAVSGGGGNDATSSGNDAAESHNIDGGDGDDIIYGSAGDDYLYGGAGSDTIYSDSSQEYTVADALAEISGLQYNADTGSFYLYVSGAVTAPTAFANAAGTSLNGVAGHVVHITSATENAYIDSLTGTATTWLGAQDTAVEGEWRWIGGELDGELFWLGNQSGSAQNGYYNNWNGGEPNDYSTGEDYAEIQNGGGWNDNGGPSQSGLSRGYVVEWEASEVFSFGATEINGGSGADDLYGSAGADLFIFDSNGGDAFTNPDTVYNFDQNDGDALDISDILSGLGVTSANLSNFVDISEANGLRIDTSGSGSFAGNEIATFSGFSGVSDEMTMFNNGNLIIA